MTGTSSSGLAIIWLKWRSSLILALRSLWLHKLRSMLSVLGIIIGTGAVITLMGFGKGSMEDALEDIRKQGTTNVILTSIKPTDENSTTSKGKAWVIPYGLTWDDFERCQQIESVIGLVPMRIFPQEVKNIDKIAQARLVATTEAYGHIQHFDMEAGRFLVDGEDQVDEGDDQRFRTVVVLGARIAEDLFPFENPVGKSVVLNKEQYVVVGVIKERTARSGAGQGQEDYNRDVYIPIKTCKVRYGPRVIIRTGGSKTGEEVQMHQITLTVKDIDQVRSTGELVRTLLERYHNRKDWEVSVPLDRLEEAERARVRYMGLLFMIGGISLVVGGIGIMNIMLATVTERTREIGIRRALGAKRRDIIMQFLIEAVVQTSIGGCLGIVVGFIGMFGIPFVVRVIAGARVPTKLEPWSIVISLFAAVFVGVCAGLYPAFRASRLDPIEALRYN